MLPANIPKTTLMCAFFQGHYIGLALMLDLMTKTKIGCINGIAYAPLSGAQAISYERGGCIS